MPIIADKTGVNKNRYSFEPFLLAISYATFFYMVQFFLHRIGMVPNIPNADNLTTWDSGIYKNIVDNGYIHTKSGSSNTGFMILFPWIWRLLHVNAIGISMVNILFFATGFAIFCRMYALSTIDKILLLTTPSIYFMFIPYTEALFFFISCSFNASYKTTKQTYCMDLPDTTILYKSHSRFPNSFFFYHGITVEQP